MLIPHSHNNKLPRTFLQAMMLGDMSTTAPSHVQRPLVFALDVGTSSVRTFFYASLGRQVEGIEGRTKYQMTATSDGGVEIDPDILISHIYRTIDEGLGEAQAAIPDLEDAIFAIGY